MHTTSEITLRDADDQSQVRFGQTLLRGDIALGDTDRKLDLFLRGKQRYTTDLLEIDLDGVVDRDILSGIDGFRAGGRVGVIAVFGNIQSLKREILFDIGLYDLDTRLFERVIELFKLFGIDIHLADRIQNILVGDITLRLTEVCQLLDEIFLV